MTIDPLGCGAGIAPASIRMTFSGVNGSGDGTIVPGTSGAAGRARNAERFRNRLPTDQLFRSERDQPAVIKFCVDCLQSQ